MNKLKSLFLVLVVLFSTTGCATIFGGGSTEVINVESSSPIKLKVVGSVYNGKRSSKFPNYLGFIVKAGEPLSFSAKEIEDNQSWTAFTPDKPADSASTPIVKDEF